MASDKTWGDEFTLRAIADTYNVHVHVITSEDHNWYLHYAPSLQKNETTQRSIFLSYVAPIHYEIVEPADTKLIELKLRAEQLATPISTLQLRRPSSSSPAAPGYMPGS